MTSVNERRNSEAHKAIGCYYMQRLAGPCSAVGSVSDSRARSRVRHPVRQHTFVSPSTDSRRTVVSYWQKYVHEVLVNRLRSVVRLTDHSDITITVYRGR